MNLPLALRKKRTRNRKKAKRSTIWGSILKSPAAIANLLGCRKWYARAAVYVAWSLFMLHALFFICVLAAALIFSVINPPFTSLIAYRRIFQGHAPIQRQFVPLEQVPVKARRMVVLVEDYRFYEHHGIDLAALHHAFKVNRRYGYTRLGGSTITMQVSRTLFLLPVKSYVRKYAEIMIALGLETVMSKHRILELYFNYAEWGVGVFGIQAAAMHYYGTDVQNLSTDRLRRLVTILANPIDYTVNNFKKHKRLAFRYEFLRKRVR